MFFMSQIAEYFRMVFSVLLAAIISFGQTAGINIPVIGYRDRLFQAPSYSFYAPTEKVSNSGSIDKTKDYTMYLAKNETEYCQIAFRVKAKRNDCTISLSEFKDSEGNVLDSEFCEVYYVKTTGEAINGCAPDGLIPIDTRETLIDCAPQTNYVFYIGVKSTENTKPGDYTATVSFERKSTLNPDTENITATVKAHVWDFTLPETPSMDTAMGLERRAIAEAHHVAVNSEECQRLYCEYYEFLLQHGISAYDLPYDVLSDEADAYMSDPRCKSFRIYYSSDDNYIKAVYEKLSAHPDWAEKAYFYAIDEPNDEEAYARYYEIANRLKRLYPGYHMVTPYCTYNLTVNGEETTAPKLQEGNSDIMCALSSFFSEKDKLTEMYERQSKGDKLWWYVCCGPRPSSDYCNLFTQYDGLKHRILFWQQKDLGITGLLYWDTNYWFDVSDIWNSAWTTPWTGVDTFGDGSLMYHGYHIGKGPVSSLRLEAVANGIEDYEYLTMAEELLGKDYVEKTINKITTDLTHYTYSDNQFNKVRTALGNAIEKAVKA